MNKVLWFDTETTGTDPVKNDIIQIAGIIEIGDFSDSFDIKCQPINHVAVEKDALDINGITLEKIKTFQTSEKGYKQFLSIMDRHIDKYDKNDKFTPAGHNVSFDLNFLQQWFIKNGNAYGTGSYQNWEAIDTLALARIMSFEGIIKVENHKLETLAERYGIEINAHDALSDITATRTLYPRLMRELREYWLDAEEERFEKDYAAGMQYRPDKFA